MEVIIVFMIESVTNKEDTKVGLEINIMFAKGS